MKKILVLYSELADYIINSFDYFAENNNSEIHVIHWPINSEAPFSFNENSRIAFYNKNDYSSISLLKLALNINADAIICAGWMDKDYLKIVKEYPKVPKILTMDNHWEGNLKQTILRAISPIYLKRLFSHIWVPGKPQKEYAKKLSFKDDQILTGFYVANPDNFIEIEHKPDHTFLFLGRYIEHKGIKDLWRAFIDLKKEVPNDWKLKCLGTGSLWDDRVMHEDIEHIGFVQPKDLNKHLSGGVFVLPSHFEPWGVVVHEFALAGFPMILSDKIGASTSLLDDNGFIFQSGNIEDLKNKMTEIIELDCIDIKKMGSNSKKLSERITNQKWSSQLNNILTKSQD